MPLLDHEFARRENSTLELRAHPIRARWELHDLITSDAHRMRCVLSCGLRAIDTATERKMFEEVFLAVASTASAHDVIDYFRSVLHSAAARVAPTKTIAEWLDDSTNAPLTDSLRDAGKSVAFTCGVELLPPFRLELSSPTFERRRMEEIQRATAERASAGQIEHLQRSAQLLRQFESLRAAVPSLSPGNVLRRINSTDQADVLHSLQMASAAENPTNAVWVVAGFDLVRIDPRTTPPKIVAIPLPQELGPLRSVSVASVSGKRALLIGARTGVLVVDAHQRESPMSYADPEIDSPHGFSRVIAWRDGIWASHRAGGLVGWNLGTRAPVHVLRPATTDGIVRNLCVLDETRLLFTAGSRLLTYDASGRTTVVDEIGETVALLPMDDRVIVVSRDGRVRILSRSTLECLQDRNPAGAAYAAALLPWLGHSRLLLSPEHGAILCVGLDDPLITHYASVHQSVSMLAGADDLVAGISSDRQRLILWQSWDGRKPVAEIHVAEIAKHRVAGIALG